MTVSSPEFVYPQIRQGNRWNGCLAYPTQNAEVINHPTNEVISTTRRIRIGALERSSLLLAPKKVSVGPVHPKCFV